jgi:hypothetical protein
MFHESRFFRALESNLDHPPSVALNHAIWAVAATESSEHHNIAADLYHLARKHAEDLEMKVNSPRTQHRHFLKLTETRGEVKIYYSRLLRSAGTL